MALLRTGGNWLAAGGTPLTSGYAFVDSFNRADGPVANGWTDAFDIWGDSQFDQATIVDGKFSIQPTHNAGGNARVCHAFIAQDLGFSDDFEVSLKWWLSDDGNITISSALQQISPCAFIDLEADEPLEMGVLPVWDLSLTATYFQNAFRSPVADCLNPAYYTSLGGDSGGVAPYSVRPFYEQTITMRCENGTLTYYWDREPTGSSIPVPSWAQGRTWFGVWFMALDYVGTYPGGSPVLEPTPGHCMDFRVRQL